MSETHEPAAELTEPMLPAELTDDPAYVALIHQVLLYQEYLDAYGSTLTAQQTAEVTEDLDKRWPYMDVGGIVISGNVRMPVIGHAYDGDTSDTSVLLDAETPVTPPPATGKMVTAYVDAVTVVSNGFIVVETPQIIDGIHFGNRKEVRLLFMREVQIADAEGTEHPMEITVTAPPDSLHIQFPFASPGHEEHILQEHIPDIMQLVDECVLNADSREDAIMALQSLVITKADCVDRSDLAKLQRYINRIIGTDSAPLHIAIRPDGIAHQTVGNRTTFSYLGGRELIFIVDQLLFTTVVNVVRTGDTVRLHTQVGDWCCALQGTMYGQDGAQDQRSIRLPLTSVHELTNLRSLLRS